jgi:hypothetical protein
MGFSHIYYYYMHTSPLYTPPTYTYLVMYISTCTYIHTYYIFLHPFLTVLIVCRWIDWFVHSLHLGRHPSRFPSGGGQYDQWQVRFNYMSYISKFIYLPIFHTLMITLHFPFLYSVGWCCCSYRTTLCLQHSPEHIGIGAIFLATLYMSLQPLNARSKDATWFEILDSDIEEEDLKSKLLVG